MLFQFTSASPIAVVASRYNPTLRLASTQVKAKSKTNKSQAKPQSKAQSKSKSKFKVQDWFALTPARRKPTPYEIFGLPQNATPAAIKARYYDLAKLYHPDSRKALHLSAAIRNKRFHMIKTAYEALRRPKLPEEPKVQPREADEYLYDMLRRRQQPGAAGTSWTMDTDADSSYNSDATSTSASAHFWAQRQSAHMHANTSAPGSNGSSSNEKQYQQHGGSASEVPIKRLARSILVRFPWLALLFVFWLFVVLNNVRFVRESDPRKRNKQQDASANGVQARAQEFGLENHVKEMKELGAEREETRLTGRKNLEEQQDSHPSRS